MNEKEIDKIFKEELQNAVEPTFESDWENFEKSLPSPGGGFFGRYFLTGLIGLLALSGMSFWLVSLSGNNVKDQYSIRTTVKKTETEMQKSTLDTTNSITSPKKNENKAAKNTSSNLSQQSKSENENIRNEAGESDRTPNDLNAKSAFNKMASTNPETENTDGLNPEKKHDQGDRNNIVSINTSKTQTTANSLAEALGNTANDSKVMKSKSTDNLSSSGDENVDSKENDSETIQNTFEPENNTSQSNSKGENSTAASDDLNLQIMEIGYINSLTGILPEPESADRGILSRDYIGFSKLKLFETLVFVGVEQNAVLKTSPQIGIMEQVHFSKWTVGLGVGLQRSGRLNWNQEATSTTYGFDKYQSGIVVNTESVDLMIIPIKLGYHLNGASRVFVGFTPSFLINARQNIQVFVDGTPDPSQSTSGYTYQTGAATFNSFLSVGYGYDLSEDWNLELGVNYGIRKWNTSSETPVGVCLRVNYIFR